MLYLSMTPSHSNENVLAFVVLMGATDMLDTRAKTRCPT